MTSTSLEGISEAYFSELIRRKVFNGYRILYPGMPHKKFIEEKFKEFLNIMTKKVDIGNLKEKHSGSSKTQT